MCSATLLEAMTVQLNDSLLHFFVPCGSCKHCTCTCIPWLVPVHMSSGHAKVQTLLPAQHTSHRIQH